MEDARHQPDIPLDEDTKPSSPLGHKLMFILLTLLAFAIYTPATLLPIVRDHCEQLAEEQRLSARVFDLQRELGRQSSLAEAFEQDALINERLAVLDLRFEKPDEIVLPVLPPRRSASSSAAEIEADFRSALRIPPAWPAWARTAEQWGQRRGLIDMFLDPSLRPIFMLMSAGLVIAAFILFAPERRPRRELSEVVAPGSPPASESPA